jgi:hypothetical protein
MKTLTRYILIPCSMLATSCVPIHEKHILADGFYSKTTSYMSEPGGQSKLCFRGKTVWNYAGVPVVHDGMAVFIGDWDGDQEYTGKCYFAAKGDGSVVRLRRLLLTRTAETIGAQPANYLKQYGDYMLTAREGIVQFDFSSRIGVNQKDLIVELTWKEISDIVDTLVKTGKPHEDKLNGIVYLE